MLWRVTALIISVVETLLNMEVYNLCTDVDGTILHSHDHGKVNIDIWRLFGSSITQSFNVHCT